MEKMKSKLEKLIIGALLEFTHNEHKFSPLIFQSILNELLKNESIFLSIPKSIFIIDQDLAPNNVLPVIPGLVKDFNINFRTQNFKKVEFYTEKGVLLYDGLHASAFGRMNYIYRSKGIRIYLTENQEVLIVCPYVTIDHNGFQFEQEEIDSYKISEINSDQIIQDILQYSKEDFNSKSDVRCGEQLIKMIVGIKEPFNQQFFLEYVFNPPDVDKLSQFSKDLRLKLWQVCLSNKFKKKWGEEIQENAMSFLAFLQILPSPLQVLKYIKKSTKTDGIKKILDRIQLLETNLLDKKENIIEFKPNISGIEINFNEIYRRIMK